MVEAGGVEPPSRDARPDPSTCVVRDLESHWFRLPRTGSGTSQRELDFAATCSRNRWRLARCVSEARVTSELAAPWLRYLGSQGEVLIGTSKCFQGFTRPPGTSTRKARRDSIRSIPVAPTLVAEPSMSRGLPHDLSGLPATHLGLERLRPVSMPPWVLFEFFAGRGFSGSPLSSFLPAGLGAVRRSSSTRWQALPRICSKSRKNSNGIRKLGAIPGSTGNSKAR